MKTIKAITTALLLAMCMTAQADRTVKAKANDGSEEHFQLSSRIVIDLTKEKPVIRNNGNSTIYRPDAEVLLQINGDLEDAIKKTEADLTGQGAIYDLSGRQVSRPAKGIYIKDGKKIVLK